MTKTNPAISKTKLLTLAFTWLLLSVSLFPAAAAESRQTVSLQAEAGFQGNFKFGEWLPVWVNLENAGSDLTGEIRVSITRDFEQITYAVPVSLANGARKRLPVYVQPNNFTHSLRVDLVAEEQVIATQTIKAYPQPNINYLIGIAAEDRGALALLSGIALPGGRMPLILDISLETLPEHTAALRTLDCLIINNIDTSTLTPEQTHAIQGWVQQGGRLILGGGEGAIRTTSGLPKEILPLQPLDLTEADDLAGLAVFADNTTIRVPGPFVLAAGEILEGQTLADRDGLPLIQETKRGEGTITFIALDLSATPFDAWTGTTVFWEKLIAPGAGYPSWRPTDMSMQQLTAGPMSNALSNLPSLDLPSAKTVTILLGVYIVLVGPVNYIVLRWRKKLHWAWISIPVITLIFAGLSFGIAYARRGTDLIINKIAVIQVQPDGPAQVNSYVGLFSPANQSYEIEVSGNNLLSPMFGYYDPWMSSGQTGAPANTLTFVQSSPSLVRGLNVNQWSMQNFMTETSLEEIQQIQTDLRLIDGNLEGTIQNTSGFALQDIILIMRPSFIRLGDLAPGESADFNMPISGTNNPMMGGSMSWRIFETEFTQVMTGPPPREIEFKRMILEALIDQQYYYGASFDPTKTRSAVELSNQVPEITLVGWMDTAPPEIRINGETPQEAATGIYLTQLPFQIPETGDVTIPAGLLPGLVAEMPFTGGTCGVETTSIWLDKGEAVIEFLVLPQFANLNIEQLDLSLYSDGGWIGNPDLAIYNWQSEDWNQMEKITMGNNIITNPGENINSEGVVRFQLSVNSQEGRGGGCYYFGLGLKGSH